MGHFGPCAAGQPRSRKCLILQSLGEDCPIGVSQKHCPGRLVHIGSPNRSLIAALNVITIVLTLLEKPVVELKVRKFGNSLGVVLPKEVVNRLQTGDGKPLFLIEGLDGGYQLTPYDPAFKKKMKKADDIISRYQNALHVLAK